MAAGKVDLGEVLLIITSVIGEEHDSAEVALLLVQQRVLSASIIDHHRLYQWHEKVMTNLEGDCEDVDKELAALIPSGQPADF